MPLFACLRIYLFEDFSHMTCEINFNFMLKIEKLMIWSKINRQLQSNAHQKVTGTICRR